jgi:hypothetical protein
VISWAILQRLLTVSSQIYATTRGRELPGNYNHMLLAKLVHVQSRSWGSIALKHAESLHAGLKTFVHALAKHIVDDEKIRLETIEIFIQHLSEEMNKTTTELKFLAGDERQQPIAYNHYYADNVQKARQADSQDLISTVMKRAAEDD